MRFFARHDGVGGAAFDHQFNGSVRERATYSLAVSNQASTNLVLDPPYTPRFEGRSAPFQFSDFAFDSHTALRRHHASYQLDWRLANGGGSGDQMMTMLADWNGERAVLESRLAGTRTHAARDNFGWALQHQAVWPRVSATIGARVERDSSFGVAAVPRASLVLVAHEAHGALGDTRVKTSTGLGIKEPTVLQSFSLSPSFLGNPDLEPERSRSVGAGVEQRLFGRGVRVGMRIGF